MALGIGEGAEQNAPLGRAVIGGLFFATVSTLFFVPVVYAAVHLRLERRKAMRRDGSKEGKEVSEENHGFSSESLTGRLP